MPGTVPGELLTVSFNLLNNPSRPGLRPQPLPLHHCLFPSVICPVHSAPTPPCHPFSPFLPLCRKSGCTSTNRVLPQPPPRSPVSGPTRSNPTSVLQSEGALTMSLSHSTSEWLPTAFQLKLKRKWLIRSRIFGVLPASAPACPTAPLTPYCSRTELPTAPHVGPAPRLPPQCTVSCRARPALGCAACKELQSCRQNGRESDSDLHLPLCKPLTRFQVLTGPPSPLPQIAVGPLPVLRNPAADQDHGTVDSQLSPQHSGTPDRARSCKSFLPPFPPLLSFLFLSSS